MSSPVSSPLAGPALRLTNAALSRARLTVVPRVRARAPRVPFVLLVSVVLALGVVGLLMFNTSMQQAAFTTSRLEDKAAALTAQEQALAVEVEALRNPQRVAEQAQAMGMVLPAASCFLALSGRQPGCAAAPAPRQLRLQPVAPVKPAILDPAPITVPAPADAAQDNKKKQDEKKAKNRRDTASASAGAGAARGSNGTTPDRGTTTRADR
jgi:cell division protein FtsL